MLLLIIIKLQLAFFALTHEKKREMREAKIGQPSSFMVNNEHMQ